MRKYMSKEYMNSLIGKTFASSDSELKQYDGLKVIEVIRELTEKDYDRELIDDTDKNEKGELDGGSNDKEKKQTTDEDELKI